MQWEVRRNHTSLASARPGIQRLSSLLATKNFSQEKRLQFGPQNSTLMTYICPVIWLTSTDWLMHMYAIIIFFQQFFFSNNRQKTNVDKIKCKCNESTKKQSLLFVEYNLLYTKPLNFAATRSQKKSRLFDNTDQEKHHKSNKFTSGTP